MSGPRNLAVYLASSVGYRPEHLEAARALGGAMVRRDLGLVYGGAVVGLMGALADTVMAGGGRAVGVITDHLLDREIGNQALTELVVVPDMAARKREMFERTDGYLTLPGGIGTMEELFEVLCWRQLGLHPKPVGLLNVGGFYDDLLAFLDRATADGFVADNALVVGTEVGSVLDAMGF